MAFKPRFTIPESGNPYYNTKKNGGYSEAIQGSPCEKGLDVLRNCVGYAYGRFNEIVGEGKMVYLAPVNAEKFIDYMNHKTKGVTSGMTPKLGACMVWQCGATKNGSDGAGHVAIVEQINADGSIITSESGYGAKKAFWTQTRNNSNGRWGESSKYTFLGFIYNPAVTDETPVASIVTPYIEHVVAKGEILGKIANFYGVTIPSILTINPKITNPNMIRTGQIIYIPIKREDVLKKISELDAKIKDLQAEKSRLEGMV